MKKETLTAYDRFIMNKKGGVNERETEERVVEEREETDMDSEYAQYLANELRRTQPSEAKVMTIDEFENLEREEKGTNPYRAFKGERGEQKEKGIRFKKFGKILLIAYIIIMLALALIVIVKTTVGDNLNAADASGTVVVEDSSSVKAMVIADEEEEESEDWFDRLCDSLK